VVARDPFVFAETSFEDSGTLVKFVGFCVNDLLVGLAFHKRLHDVLDQVNIACWKPGRRFPEQPAIDLIEE
jgi:hypothetical protein